MQITEEAYLEHHGVKGMRWGLRNDKKNSDNASAQRKRVQRVGAALGVAGIGVAGILLSKKFIGTHNHVPIAQVNEAVRVSAHNQAARDLIQANWKRKSADIWRVGWEERSMPQDQAGRLARLVGRQAVSALGRLD